MKKSTALAASSLAASSRVPRSTISTRPRTRLTAVTAPAQRVRSHQPPAENYAARVLAGEFEPVSTRAREIAASRGTTLHALAHELGFADTPPRVRAASVDLTKLSRSELAAASGYSRSDISRLFAHKHPPTLTKLARVAAAYGVWMDEMLTALGW